MSTKLPHVPVTSLLDVTRNFEVLEAEGFGVAGTRGERGPRGAEGAEGEKGESSTVEWKTAEGFFSVRTPFTFLDSGASGSTKPSTKVKGGEQKFGSGENNVQFFDLYQVRGTPASKGKFSITNNAELPNKWDIFSYDINGNLLGSTSGFKPEHEWTFPSNGVTFILVHVDTVKEEGEGEGKYHWNTTGLLESFKESDPFADQFKHAFGQVELKWVVASFAELEVTHGLGKAPKFVFLSVDQDLTANSWQNLTAPVALFSATKFTIQSTTIKEEKITAQIKLNWWAVG